MNVQRKPNRKALATARAKNFKEKRMMQEQKQAEMRPEVAALRLLDDVTRQVNASRDSHKAIIQSVEIMQAAIGELFGLREAMEVATANIEEMQAIIEELEACIKESECCEECDCDTKECDVECSEDPVD